MNSLITSINYALGTGLGWIGQPLASIFSDFFALFVFSSIIGVVFAYLYGKLSSQEQIKATKKKIGGHLLEAVLFKHDPVTTVRAQGGLLWSGIKYLSTTFVPIFVLFVPSIFLFSALQNNYGFDIAQLRSGEELVVKVSKEESPYAYSVEGEGITLSPPLRVESQHELVHKLEIKEASEKLVLTTPKETSDLTGLLLKNKPALITKSFLDAFFYGSYIQPPAGVEYVSVDKPFRDYALAGLVCPWYVWSIIFILVAGFAGAKVLKISF